MTAQKTAARETNERTDSRNVSNQRMTSVSTLFCSECSHFCVDHLCILRFLDYFTNNTMLYLNTGLSSSVNWGRKLLTEEADIVTAHGNYFVLLKPGLHVRRKHKHKHKVTYASAEA